MTTKIQYHIGDVIQAAIKKDPTQHIIIPHVCNDKYRWGSGFVIAISQQWNLPEQMYRSHPDLQLGDTQFVQVIEFLR